MGVGWYNLGELDWRGGVGLWVCLCYRWVRWLFMF